MCSVPTRTGSARRCSGLGSPDERRKALLRRMNFPEAAASGLLVSHGGSLHSARWIQADSTPPGGIISPGFPDVGFLIIYKYCKQLGPVDIARIRGL